MNPRPPSTERSRRLAAAATVRYRRRRANRLVLADGMKVKNPVRFVKTPLSKREEDRLVAGTGLAQASRAAMSKREYDEWIGELIMAAFVRARLSKNK